MRLKVLLVVGAGALLLTGCSKGPESTVESFYNALSKGEVTEAKGYFSAQLSAKVGDAKISSALAKEATRLNQCGGIKSIEVKLQGEGEIRNGTVDLTFGSDKCKPKTEKTALVQEDGKWKITAGK